LLKDGGEHDDAFDCDHLRARYFFAGPAAAQQLTEQDGRQIVDGIEKVKAKAFETKDAVIWGSVFANNAIQLPLSGKLRWDGRR
jgi:hypothetical protein